MLGGTEVRGNTLLSLRVAQRLCVMANKIFSAAGQRAGGAACRSQDALPSTGSLKSFSAHDPKVEGLASEASPSIWETAPVLAWRDDSMRRTSDAFSVHLTASGLSLIFSYPLHLSLPAL